LIVCALIIIEFNYFDPHSLLTKDRFAIVLGTDNIYNLQFLFKQIHWKPLMSQGCWLPPRRNGNLKLTQLQVLYGDAFNGCMRSSIQRQLNGWPGGGADFKNVVSLSIFLKRMIV
jgi:hypothetical protein